MPDTSHNAAAGIGFILLAMLAISFNDMTIKLLSGGYPLHQLVFFRSTIGIVFSLMLVKYEGGWRILKTSRPGLHLVRALLLVLANLTFFSALASLQLAEVTAIFFISPLIITLLSIPILGEKVGPLRIGAVAVGFVGVMIMVRPWAGSGGRDAAWYIYLLPVVAATAYALSQLLTRKLGATTRASAMAVYAQSTFIIVTVLFWMIAGDGRFVEGLENDSLVFILRAWIWPTGHDLWLFGALALASTFGSYTVAQAYRMANAATLSPFEYAGLPLAIMWGYVIWGDLPAPQVMAGIALIIGSGLFVFLRERQKGRGPLTRKRINRRF
ncbi:DMT family transporter [Rhodobacteraceae bacterium KMM 6894]|nr:DMT family transporter [Rhodobacteraceae bacterium KMM 6894]